MKTILAFGDSNTWGAIPAPAGGGGERFASALRWPGIVRERLAPAVCVIEEGLSGRTTCLDDPVEGRHKNGERLLLALLETHAPLDLVIIKLGTNDLKARFAMQAGDIAEGAGRLVDVVRHSAAGLAVLLVAPAPLARLTGFAEMFEGGAAKSERFASAFARVAAARGVAMLDAGSVVTSSDVDGIHLDEPAHRALGEAIAARVAEILGL